MSWASGRRALILFILFAVIAAIVTLTLIATLYKTPTCADNEQNQDEEGVDCGGVCERICTPSTLPPAVSFVRAIPGTNGRVDIVAYVENKNAGVAAKKLAYQVELLSEEGVVLTTKEGTVDLAPSDGTPIYLPNAYTGEVPVARAFMTLNETVDPWYRFEKERIVPGVEDVQIGTNEKTPRVTAVITNSEATTLRNIKVIATVFNEEGNAIAASQTILNEIPAQGKTLATFTWNIPFVDPPARVDVRPVIPLP